MLKIFLITLVFLAAGFTLMLLKIIVQKDGKFPAFQVGHNKDMKKMGIKCARSEEIIHHRKRLKRKSELCAACSEAGSSKC